MDAEQGGGRSAAADGKRDWHQEATALAQGVLELTEDAQRWEEQAIELAKGVLQLADVGGMPDSFWQTDSRVERAREVLGVPEDGRYSHEHLWEKADD